VSSKPGSQSRDRRVRARPSGGDVLVALLRGINVSGKNPLPMADLTRIFERAGAVEIRTYIQSGNVVFRATPKVAKSIAHDVSKAIHQGPGWQVPVVIRSAEELRQVPRDNPFLNAVAEPTTLHVAFLATTPDPARVAALDPKRSPPDRFVLRGRDVYLHCPNGIGRSKLTNAYFDAALNTVSTMRNWRTVQSLLDLVGDFGADD